MKVFQTFICSVPDGFLFGCAAPRSPRRGSLEGSLEGGIEKDLPKAAYVDLKSTADLERTQTIASKELARLGEKSDFGVSRLEHDNGADRGVSRPW